jgi:hypothetical protein
MNGELTLLADDPVGVPDDATLYRRVDWDRIGGRAKYGAGEVGRLNPNAFTDYDAVRAAGYGYAGPCMSVGTSTVLDALGKRPSVLLEGFPDYGLARVRAGDLRRLVRLDGTACPQGIMLAPTQAEPWHAVIFDLAGGKRTNAVAKAIVRIAEWEIELINT